MEQATGIVYQPRGIADAVQAAEGVLRERHAVERLNKHEAALWSDDSAVTQQISNSLGWLDVAAAMAERWPELARFRDAARADGFTDAVLLGMGGSSLISIVWTEVFQQGPEGLRLHVLDSTDPETVETLKNRLPLATTLFLVASKSGTTTEPDRFHRFFWGAVEASGRDPARQFVAITDPGTALHTQASQGGWRAVFLNPADIGGRYSALSLFGLVPAALMDLPGDRILASAERMHDRIQNPADAPHLALGAMLGGAARAAMDKCTLAFEPVLAPFATWLEQLLAESTGKHGTGVIPVTESRVAGPAQYGRDRLLVRAALAGHPADPDFDALTNLNPAVRITLEDTVELGGQFLLWEAATALVGRVLGINPFDQPNVQESKDNTKAMLEVFSEQGALPEVEGAPSFAVDSPALRPALDAWLHGVGTGEYIAIMAYVPESEAATDLLHAAQAMLRNRLRIAVTVGYGPRFLHSTGQLHKGGPATGRFLQLTALSTRVPPLPIPGTGETFNVLIDAQARGDLKALASRGRPVLSLSMGGNVVEGLRTLVKELEALS